MSLTSLSRELSRILRHRPDSVGVTLDKHGWCAVDELIQGLAKGGIHVSREQLEQVVRTNDKKRFVLSPDGDWIRAAQGHSLGAVTPLLRCKKPPSRLFHGTVSANLAGIESKGLLPMRRHHVHLSTDEQAARAVGARRGEPVVLVVDAGAMERDGYRLFISENGVWLTERVPSKYVKRAI